MKYRKKPVVIEAFQYDGDLVNSDGNYYVPDFARKSFDDGIMYFQECAPHPSELFIKTLEGDMYVNAGDYIIKGIQGELYPCKPNIFHATYKKMEDK